MPKEETIEIRHVRGVVGEKENLPKLSPRSSITSRLQSLILKSLGIPYLIHLFGVLEKSSTLTFDAGEDLIAALHTDGTNLYAGLRTTPGKVVKVDLTDFTKVSTLTFDAGEDTVRALASDGVYLYAGLSVNPGKVVRILLSNFTKDSTVTFAAGENDVRALISDGTNLYAGLNTVPGKVVKVNLSTFTATSTLDLNGVGEQNVTSFYITNSYLYAGMDQAPGIVAKIDLGTFTKTASVTFVWGETSVSSLWSDGTYLYAGCQGSVHVVKIDLNTFLRVGSLVPTSAGEVTSLTSIGPYLYVNHSIAPGEISRIDLVTFSQYAIESFSVNEDFAKAIVTDGTYLYVGLDTSPGKLVRKYVIPTTSVYEKKIDSIYNKTTAGVTTGTYTHANGVTEDDVLAFSAATQDIYLRLDVNALTQATVIKEYEEVDGATYRQVSRKEFPKDFATDTKTISIYFKQANRDYKVTMQSSVAEGAQRSIPYVYRTEPRS